MSKKSSTTVSASVRHRLLNLSKESNEDFNLILTRYAVERFLYRLTRSTFAEEFILKGAMLLAVWMGRSHRSTRDLDLLGFGDASAQHLKKVFQQICQTEVADDGLNFEAKAIEVMEIRGGHEYPGQRIKLTATLGSARIRVQIDVGFGDAVFPKAELIEFPVLLDHPHPRIRTYPREAVVAEKLQAMVALGMISSRMKDYYDLHSLSKMFTFDGSTLVQAIGATFERRRTEIPAEIPVALGEKCAGDSDKLTQWQAFLSRSDLEPKPDNFARLLDELRAFLLQPLHAAARADTFEKYWPAGGPWSSAFEKSL